MSKLIDRLQRAGQFAPAPLGFGAASGRGEAAPSILLVGLAAQEELARSPGSATAPVDALLVSQGSGSSDSLSKLADAVEGRLWGARVSRANQDQVADLKEMGCDFIVFDADDTSAAVLGDEDLGKLLAIGPDLSEDLARAIHELPIDGVLFSPQDDLLPLTVKKMIDIQVVRTLVDKSFVMVSPGGLGRPELETLRDAGIEGLAVDLSDSQAVTDMKEAIAQLKRPRPKARTSLAMVPRASGHIEPPGHDGDEDGDDDF